MVERLTIKQAAQALGVSEKTVRRMIKDGRLKAYLEPSVYGQQYYIPAEQISSAMQIVEAIKVKKEYSIEEVALALSKYFSEKDKKFTEIIEKLSQKLETIEKQNSELKEEILKLQSQLQQQNKERSIFRIFQLFKKV